MTLVIWSVALTALIVGINFVLRRCLLSDAERERQRKRSFADAAAELSAAIVTFRATLVDELTPAMNKARAAMDRFAELLEEKSK